MPKVDLTSFPLKPYVAITVPRRPELAGKPPPGAAYATLVPFVGKHTPR